MKTSTMLILTAVLITLGGLIAYNFKLKEVYTSGEYKSRFIGMDFTPLNAIEKINIKSANLLGVQVEQGNKEGIWIAERAKDKELIGFDLRQHTLTLDLSAAARTSGFHTYDNDVIIITKKLNAISTMPFFNEEEKKKNQFNSSSETVISGYRLDHLDLQIGTAVSVYLNNMQLNSLNAVVGNKKEGGAELVLSADNKINTAQLNVPGKSRLSLIDPKIVKTSYNLSDSATVSLNGKTVQRIK